MPINVLLTGATGFLGGHVANFLENKQDVTLTCAVRGKKATNAKRNLCIKSINSTTDWSAALVEQEVVIHAAGLAHAPKGGGSQVEFDSVNWGGTFNLASQAAAAGVKRFIFVSSIGVNGTQTLTPFTEYDLAKPKDPYASSKWKAEQALWGLQSDKSMDVVVIRAPLIYGPKAPGNFSALSRLVRSGLPLPLASVNNKRSFVGIDNLVSLIATCIDHPRAANQLFLSGDGRDLSTTELLQLMAVAMGKPSRLIPVPAPLLMFCATILGKRTVAQRLLGSLQVDISKAREVLGWEPPVTVEEGLKRCFDSV